MSQLTVRDVPPDILEELRAEARERGRSLNAQVRAALAEHVARRQRQRRLRAAIPSVDALRERIARRLGHDVSDSTELIREDRER